MTAIISQLPIEIPSDRIAELCQRHHIRKLSFFGSILRNDFRPDSDIDILVEFEPGCTPGFAFIDIQDELSQLLGRRVDLNTPQDLSRYIRERVLAEAQVQYVKNG
ncbi:nucleotidyltransferase [Scytonema sp. NUACC21]